MLLRKISLRQHFTIAPSHAAKLRELLADSTATGDRQGAIPRTSAFCRRVAEGSQDSPRHFANVNSPPI
jgi:hypothetical protein